MHRNTLAILLSLAFATSAAFAADNDVHKVLGGISANAGQTYGDLSTVNGSIDIADGVHSGNAGTVNGSVKAGNDIAARDLTTVNGQIRVGTHCTISGEVKTVNGGIFVDRDGSIGKGVTSVNGAIELVSTQVDGSINTVAGDITVGVGSHVYGDVRVNKPNANWRSGNKRDPRIVIGPNAVVDGDLVFERSVTLYVHRSAKVGKITGATAIAYDGTRAP